jgi:flagellar motor switch protein FliG
MDIEKLRKILRDFSQEAKSGKIQSGSSSASEAVELGAIAENFESKLGKAVRLNEIKSNTISFAPGTCPTCGK